MDDIKSASLTKCCFVHKPEKNKKKKGSDVIFSANEDAKQDLWNEVEDKIQKIEKKVYTETFLNGIVKFINDSYQFSLSDSHEVPAAVLIMGVNMPDHSHIFNLLEDYLHQNDILSTVILESKKCANVTNMCQAIVCEIVAKFNMHLNAGIESPKKQECSFSKVHEIFSNIAEKKSSPRKMPPNVKTKKRNLSKALVFLVQDVESFSSDVLQELVLLCKIYSSKLPIVLIFGMASAMVTLHSILPQKALCCLGVETFYSVSPSEYLTEIIQEVVISPDMPFKFGPKVFRLIVDTVLYHDFSLSNLTYMLKFAMIEHFYGKNFTALCCHESEIEERVHNLSTKALDEMKNLPSLKMYLDNNPKFIACMKSTSAFKESVIGFIQKIFLNQKYVLLLLKLLHCFVKDLPNYPLGKQLRELYSASLGKEIYLTDAFNEAIKLLRMQSQLNLQSKLESCIVILQEADFESSLLKNIKEVVERSIEKLSKVNAGESVKPSQSSLLLDSETITSRFQLQEKLQMSLKMKRSNFDETRNEIIDDVIQIFKNIIPPSQLPLYEIFYFDDVHSLKKHLMAIPRVTSCYALTNPHNYLKCACCKVSTTDETQCYMPDICILYKLHLECGKLINLCDWLEAFKTIKSSGKTTTKRPKIRNKADDEELNIRFLLAVSELQMLGFIKQTKRKTDHVARVTFGNF